MRRLIRTKKHPNATTRTGYIVHKSDKHGYPICDTYRHSAYYTDEDVNCPKCLEKEN